MNTKDLLEPYAGELSVAEIVEGMNAAERNAYRLLQDAEVLLSAERYPSATALAILSIEEAGKVTVLRDLSTAPDANEVRRIWKEFRSHTKKNRDWILPELVVQGVPTDSLHSRLYDPESDHPAVLDALKQVAIYTDCLAKRHWAKPWEVASQSLASSIVATARLSAHDKQYSVEEMELWIQFIGPARKVGSSSALIAACLSWEQEAIRRGWAAESPARQFMREALLSLDPASTKPAGQM